MGRMWLRSRLSSVANSQNCTVVQPLPCHSCPHADAWRVGDIGRLRASLCFMKAITFVITGAVLATLAFAGSHTALNGTWVLEPTQSDFGGQPVIQTGTVTINER